jgi:hypothetical protein
MNKTLFLLLLLSAMAFHAGNVLFGQRTDTPIREPYKPISGSWSGAAAVHSPDPLVAYRWDNPQATDSLEIYTLNPVNVRSDNEASVEIVNPSSLKVTGACNLMFDFGRVSAAWFEFDSDNLDGDIEMSISEYNEPAIFNIGAQHPHKTARPVKYGHTFRLELNKELYEGVRFAWIHIKTLSGHADLSNIRLVCQAKPVNYDGSFSCSDTLFTRMWYTGAYTTRLNLLYDYFGAILMERSDRHSWTGDAHPSQAASMVAFGNYDFVKTNLRYTGKKSNGIASYSIYWVLSLIDYYNYTGDRALLDEMLDNACDKLDAAYLHFDNLPNLGFNGWDERLGAGFEKPNCEESKNVYRMLCIRAWSEFANILAFAEHHDLTAKYRNYADEKIKALRGNPSWTKSLGIHSAAEVVNAGFADVGETEALRQNVFADRLQRVSYSPFNQFFIMQSLARMRRHSEALTTADDCWGGQLRYGGTTFFEVFRPSWNNISQPNDAPVNNQCGYTSLTHPWSSGVTKWLSEEVLGVKPLTPGFVSFVFKPYLSDRITWVKGSVPTLNGVIAASFDLLSGEGSLTAPSGTVATVAIPKAGRKIAKVAFEGNSRKKQKPSLTGEDDDYLYYNGFEAGAYKIKVHYKSTMPVSTIEPMNYDYNEATVTVDARTQGNWKGKYGTKGYMLINFDSLQHRTKLPDFIDDIRFNLNANIHWATGVDDTRALVSDAGDARRNIGAIHTNDPHACLQTMTVDISSKPSHTYRVSLYFVDWDRMGRRSAIEVFGIDDKRLLMPVQMVREYGEGKYVTFTFNQPVRLRINMVRGLNAALSGIFID